MLCVKGKVMRVQCLMVFSGIPQISADTFIENVQGRAIAKSSFKPFTVFFFYFISFPCQLPRCLYVNTFPAWLILRIWSPVFRSSSLLSQRDKFRPLGSSRDMEEEERLQTSGNFLCLIWRLVKFTFYRSLVICILQMVRLKDHQSAMWPSKIKSFQPGKKEIKNHPQILLIFQVKSEWLVFVSVDMTPVISATARQYCFNLAKFSQISFTQFFFVLL